MLACRAYLIPSREAINTTGTTKLLRELVNCTCTAQLPFRYSRKLRSDSLQTTPYASVGTKVEINLAAEAQHASISPLLLGPIPQLAEP